MSVIDLAPPNIGVPGASAHFLHDRKLDGLRHFSTRAEEPDTLDLRAITAGSASIERSKNHIRTLFGDTRGPVAQFRYALDLPILADGLGVRVRLNDWHDIDYVAIGYDLDGVFHHVKATHPELAQWFEFGVGFGDLAWGWRNQWENPDATEITEVRFYIKGKPGPEASCDISDLFVWKEADGPIEEIGDDVAPSEVLLDTLVDYQASYFPNYRDQAITFHSQGSCPLAGEVMLDWPVDSPYPPALAENGTYQYSFHSLHPAVMLMLLAVADDEVAPLVAARDMIVDWLTRSYDQPDPNMKYAWYDHGVAERQMAFLMMDALGRKNGFDARFHSRLRSAILAHARFLASEVFYAGHQRSRYHNHAWFQDLALMATGIAFPQWRASKGWIDLALHRISDQFDKLIVDEGRFAVFAENSIGYHQGVSRIVGNIARFAELSGRDTDLPELVEKLDRFTAIMQFPGSKRTAGQGDTFRMPNVDEIPPRARIPYGSPRTALLRNAGYGVAKADHDGSPFGFYFYATSKSSTHKHADNGSFVLFFDGIEWLVDPSFYSHEYLEPVPAFLRGPNAHNAFVLPDDDYAIDPGLCTLNGQKNDEHFVFEMNHEAVEGAKFMRRVEGRLDGLNLRFDDLVVLDDNTRREEPRLMFTCGEGVAADRVGENIVLSHRASSFVIEICVGASRSHVHRGQHEAPVRGVAGTGFLQSNDVATIEVQPADGDRISWTLRARRA